MAFDFTLRPPWPTGAVILEAAVDRVTRTDPRAGCFAVRNTALITQTILVTTGIRVMTPRLIPPFTFINIETDTTANGQVEAGALPGYARASVEVTVLVRDTALRVLSPFPPRPNFFPPRSSFTAPVFFGGGFPFSGTAFADTSFRGAGMTGPLIIEVRINSWATAAGWARAASDINNACVTMIRAFSS